MVINLHIDDEQIRKERNFQVRNSHSIAVLFIVDVEEMPPTGRRAN